MQIVREFLILRALRTVPALRSILSTMGVSLALLLNREAAVFPSLLNAAASRLRKNSDVGWRPPNRSLRTRRDFSGPDGVELRVTRGRARERARPTRKETAMRPDDEWIDPLEYSGMGVDPAHLMDPVVDDTAAYTRPPRPHLFRLEFSADQSDLASAVQQHAQQLPEVPMEVALQVQPGLVGSHGGGDVLPLAGVLIAIVHFIFEVLDDHRDDDRKRDPETWRKSLAVALLKYGIVDYKVRMVQDFDAWRRGRGPCAVIIATADDRKHFRVTLRPAGDVTIIDIDAIYG